MNRQSVLVIDDSTLIHALVRARLEDEPIDLHSALDAATGLEMASRLTPDLILLDVEMPGVDGFETCRRLKINPKTMPIPVVFLTGVSDAQQKVMGLELGATDYITKPFDPAELRARVRAALRTKYLLDLLAKRAMIDGLTGLWNRACFEQRLESELALSRRSGRPVACMLLDVDHFKKLNDTWGHPFGDEVLRGIAQTLQECSREEDVVCRYGGEEFVMLLPNTAATQAATGAERIRGAIAAQKFTSRRQTVPVTCSIGVSDNASGGSLIDLADKALYSAKQNGRDSVMAA
jgi:diguanylate cyclase (GGDEF)-like protein